jgi:hypothetical protein
MTHRYLITGPGDALCPECLVHLTDSTHKFCGLCGAPMKGLRRTGLEAAIQIAMARTEADEHGDPVH